MSKNKNLNSAKKAKNDEFYTKLEDIEKEVSHYKKHFENKTVYCNCDDSESNFYTFFYLQFNSLKLKRLVTTHFSQTTPAFKIEVIRYSDYNRTMYENNSNIISVKHDTYNNLDVIIIKEKLKTNGDFRSPECIELLKEADIVVTNPPFSLFREFINLLVKYNKKFLIIGSMNAITYTEVFPLIKENKIWLGYSVPKEFEVPMKEPYISMKRTYQKNNKLYKKFGNITWYTNLEIDKRNEELILYRTYNPADYPKYDNYDAIEVLKVADIPKDYDGVMGVPITFLDKHNPEQFEIIDIDKRVTTDKNRCLLNGKRKYARILIKRNK